MHFVMSQQLVYHETASIQDYIILAEYSLSLNIILLHRTGDIYFVDILQHHIVRGNIDGTPTVQLPVDLHPIVIESQGILL